ncbi:MAG TPA: hypothetical protein VGR96_12200, partial [Acidobacteriaceae bacterium]|nr:hypothetical protein [Acidobacteriaceae bacterium]
ADPDIWWHLRNAEYQVLSHSFIVRDMYSFTAAGMPWINHEWLAELPFYFGWRLLRARGLYLVTLCAIEVILLGVFRLACRKSESLRASVAVTAVASVLATVSFGPRTLLFGWICLVAELLILDRFFDARFFEDRFLKDERLIWALPPLFLLWVNTHGSWLIGMVLFTLFILSGSFSLSLGAIENVAWTRSQRRKLAASWCLSLGALFVNPYGWRLVVYPFDLAFHQRLNIANVQEWESLDFHSPRGRIFLGSLILFFLLQLIRRRIWAPYELAFLAVGVYSSFTYSRFLFLAGILVMPLMAKDLAGLGACLRAARRLPSPDRPARNRPWLNAALLLILALWAVHRFPRESRLMGSQSAKFPQTALQYLSGFHPRGNVFNDYLWGGFLSWNTRQIPLLIDSRVDIFEYKGVLRDYLDATRLRNTLAVLDKYKIRYVLFAKDTPLVYFLSHTGSWKVDYQDHNTVLLERAAPGPLM